MALDSTSTETIAAYKGRLGRLNSALTALKALFGAVEEPTFNPSQTWEKYGITATFETGEGRGIKVKIRVPDYRDARCIYAALGLTRPHPDPEPKTIVVEL